MSSQLGRKLLRHTALNGAEIYPRFLKNFPAAENFCEASSPVPTLEVGSLPFVGSEKCPAINILKSLADMRLDTVVEFA